MNNVIDSSMLFPADGQTEPKRLDSSQSESILKKYNALNERIIRLEAIKESTTKEYNSACQESIRLFGTCDLNELRSIAKKINNENKQRIEKFNKDFENAARIVSEIESNLAAINQ